MKQQNFERLHSLLSTPPINEARKKWQTDADGVSHIIPSEASLLTMGLQCYKDLQQTFFPGSKGFLNRVEHDGELIIQLVVRVPEADLNDIDGLIQREYQWHLAVEQKYPDILGKIAVTFMALA